MHHGSKFLVPKFAKNYVSVSPLNAFRVDFLSLIALSYSRLRDILFLYKTLTSIDRCRRFCSTSRKHVSFRTSNRVCNISHFASYIMNEMQRGPQFVFIQQRTEPFCKRQLEYKWCSQRKPIASLSAHKQRVEKRASEKRPEASEKMRSTFTIPYFIMPTAFKA